MDEPSRRVSDSEREQAVVSLRDQLVDGRLTLEEFAERVETAYRARDSGELARVDEDLQAAGGAQSRRKPTRLTAAFFGRVVRRGRLRLCRSTTALSLFADVDFDLREAEIDGPVIRLNVLALFGNVDIYAPERVNVDVGGVTVFGHRREWGRDVAGPDAPTIRVRVWGWFGTVDVWRIPYDMRGDYGEIFRRLREQQRQLPA